MKEKIIILLLLAAAGLCVGYGLGKLALVKRSSNINGIVRLVDSTGDTYCSGTVVNDHIIITAGHCVLQRTLYNGAMLRDRIEIRGNDNIELGVYGTAYYAQPQLDHGLIYGDFRKFDSYKIITDVDRLYSMRVKGRKFMSCGYPLGGHLYCTTMLLEGPMVFFWETTGLLLPGMSGGPMLTDGDVVVAVNVEVNEHRSMVSPIYNLSERF